MWQHGGLQQKAPTSFSAAALLETSPHTSMIHTHAPGPRASVPVCWELDDHMTKHSHDYFWRANERKDVEKVHAFLYTTKSMMKVDQTKQTRRDEGAVLHSVLLSNIASKSATIYALFILFILPIVS